MTRRVSNCHKKIAPYPVDIRVANKRMYQMLWIRYGAGSDRISIIDRSLSSDIVAFD